MSDGIEERFLSSCRKKKKTIKPDVRLTRPRHAQTPAKNERSSSQLSHRLREIVKEGNDLNRSENGEAAGATPFIKEEFFKEVFESERGSKLIIHGE